MGMYYSIELKNNEEIGCVNFPYPLSYFFEQIGGYENPIYLLSLWIL